MKTISLFAFLFLSAIISNSQTTKEVSSNGKIISYFTRPVNNSVSSGTNAIYLNKLVDDTLIAYINRAKYSLDMAVYSLNEEDNTNGSISKISTAINNAYSRGVKVRYIYDRDSSNPTLALLDSNIYKLISAKSTATDWYGLMHNKFMVIDANSSNENDAIVWTGSTNWTTTQINKDANNVIIIQDKAVAQAYTTEFNEMWGGTDSIPDLVNSKFGFKKTDNTQHIFDVAGTIVEVYFSPSDGVNSKIQNAVATANTDLYFGIYSFTIEAISDLIENRFNNDVYTAGIIDPTSKTYAPYVNLSPIMGTNLLLDNTAGLYHNKMLIVDPSSPALDPLVLTGSHNWSASADTKNDENTVIIHDASIANQYYQSFYQNFVDVGGIIEIQTGISNVENQSHLTVYPNPCSDFVTIKSKESAIFKTAKIKIFDSLGREIITPIFKNNESIIVDTKQFTEGLYFLRIETDEKIKVEKLQVVK